MKKITRIFLTIIILFIIFLFVYLTPKNYDLEYKINDVLVKESYNKDQEYYLIEYSFNDSYFKQVVYDDYTKARKLVQKIDVIEHGDIICLVGKSKEIEIYPVCKDNEENISYRLVDKLKEKFSKSYFNTPETINETYKNISLNYLNDKTFLIWNYNGIEIINKDIKKTVDFFEKDIYEIKLASKVNNYFVIPNYEADYYFDSIYLYNVDKDRQITWNLNTSISFDSYVMGTFEKSLYIFDKKQKKEYELVPHKEKLRKVSPTILSESNFEDISLQKLINKEMMFTYDTPVEYKLQNGKLYKTIQDYNELISNHEVKEIVYQDKDEVYYLVDDSLYLYNDIYGEIKIMTNFEWTFNYENLIFIY